MLRYLALSGALLLSGCTLLPQVVHQPTLHNPFPQLSRVAIAPFFNLSDEPTLDGRKVALAYFNELQLVPGFEVVPVGTVEQALRETNNQLAGPEDARRLAQFLGVDAVVIGAVTDYSPYYPPRCTLQVEWYAANPGFHPIPPGYGLPWGTREEQEIPGALVFEAEMALAREQLETQTPSCPATALPQWGDGATSHPGGKPTPGGAAMPGKADPRVKPLVYEEPGKGQSSPTANATATTGSAMPPDWPNPQGFIPPPPSPVRPVCRPSRGPVMRHTRAYNGQDGALTEALATYHLFQDDARFGGWQNYLQRSDDFVRFCCHMHIWEMLSARGGAGETRVVWRWPTFR
jgi:hypothetical protein